MKITEEDLMEKSTEKVSENSKYVEKNKRKRRTKFDSNDIKLLDNFFQFNRYPNVHQRIELSQALNVNEFVIQTWFKNKRARSKAEFRFTQEISLYSQPTQISNDIFYTLPNTQTPVFNSILTPQNKCFENNNYFMNQQMPFRDVTNIQPSHQPATYYPNRQIITYSSENPTQYRPD
ncbi:hypothetical protein HZS_5246, partial [Henneguya salminicola]